VHSYGSPKLLLPCKRIRILAIFVRWKAYRTLSRSTPVLSYLAMVPTSLKVAINYRDPHPRTRIQFRLSSCTSLLLLHCPRIQTLQALTESTVPLSRIQLSLTHADFCARNSIFNTNVILCGIVCCVVTGGYRTGRWILTMSISWLGACSCITCLVYEDKTERTGPTQQYMQCRTGAQEHSMQITPIISSHP
jgi:hypothetical protein